MGYGGTPLRMTGELTGNTKKIKETPLYLQRLN
jgi:hypothetical protein